ncbi:MAG TPA: RNB domain-containing ribonuclease [Gemmatimonadaceae bacterium]|nr:RNB domain-containing ribonuclease [Gemmatimonadaceae bacterium]
MTTGATPRRAAFDLQAAARRDMHDNGFTPDLPADAAHQLADIVAHPAPNDTVGRRDLRALLWSSVDNDDTRDFDQLEIVEPLDGNAVRLRVAIADVDALLPAGSPLDDAAAANATSVYLGVHTFTMIPEPLCYDLTSLRADADRSAVVVEADIAADGTIARNDVYTAIVRNQAQLAYPSLGDWLEGRGAAPPSVAASRALADQLHAQHDLAQRLRTQRESHGALELETIEATPVVSNGTVTDLTLVRDNAARRLIEDFMIAANMAMGRFLAARHRSALLRVVRTPERWPRIVQVARDAGDTLPDTPDSVALSQFLARRRAADPDHFPDLSLTIVKLLGPGTYAVTSPNGDDAGHFGLAVSDYTHSTAPNRRYADLVMQRLVKAAVAGAPAPYDDATLGAIAQHCTEREDAARKVERLARKQAAAVMLAGRVGETFDAIVTGATPKGTFVRLVHPPAEGMVVSPPPHIDVGDRVRAQLIATRPEPGYIDFRIAKH